MLNGNQKTANSLCCLQKLEKVLKLNNQLSKILTVMCIFICDFDKYNLRMLKGKQTIMAAAITM